MKRRIAFISEHASPLATLGGQDSGGQNVYVAELAKHLEKIGYNVDVYTRKESVKQTEIVNWLPGIRVVHTIAGPSEVIAKENLLPFMNDFAANMISFIKNHQLHYDLIHANFFMSGVVASIVKKNLKIPFAITFHALGAIRKIHQKAMDRFPQERVAIEKQLMHEADAIIAECPQDQEDMIVHYGADRKKMTIIPCGFSRDEFQPIEQKTARIFLDLPLREKIILQLGRMVPRKGIDNVIRAVAKLKNHPNTRLVIVGGSNEIPDPTKCPELARLQALAEKEKAVSQITFVGSKQRNILKYYYSAADIFVSTPWYEPFGITPLEAMASGAVVIGSNVGGIKFSVEDGKTGFLVPPHEPELLAQKIKLLLANRNLWKAMRYNALQRVNTLFTWQEVAKKCDQLFQQIIQSTNIRKASSRVISMDNYPFTKVKYLKRWPWNWPSTAPAK